MAELTEDTTKKISFALIGCGAIANKYMIAINRIDNAEVVGAYDIDSHAARAFCEKNSIPTFTTDVEAMIEKTEPHVLNILTPSGNHVENILELICFNKYFVMEKPLALRIDQVERIIEECDANGIKIFVVQQNRFSLPTQKLKESLDKGRFGKLVLGTVRVRWCRITGIL